MRGFYYQNDTHAGTDNGEQVKQGLWYPYESPNLADALNPKRYAEWSREGMRVAQRLGYPAWLERGQRMPPRYREYVWPTTEGRVALAGYRLADILNRVLGS